MTLEEANRIRQACLDHAEELLLAASALLTKHPYLTYHLSTLALEEVGKGIQIGMTTLPPQGKKPPLSDIDDHVQKLFWALWNPRISRESLTPEHMNQCREISKEIHRIRLKGLYVDYVNNSLSIPKDMVDIERATELLALAKQRLELARLENIPNPSPDDKSLLDWFFITMQDERNAKFIFSKASMDKLGQSPDTALWFRWIKEQFEKNEQETQDILKKELERKEPQGTERTKPKWQIRILLLTSSHSIRQTELNWVNRLGDFWKLERGKDQTELFVTMHLPSGIPVQGLWPSALSESRRFAAAINVASLGLFWWQIPVDVSKFYLKMVDLENNCEVMLERTPKLTLDWGNNVLGQQILSNMLMTYRFLPRLLDGKEVEMIVRYLKGVALLGKNDIHLQMEPIALAEFYGAFRAAMRLYGDWDGETPFESAAKAMFDRDFAQLSGWPEVFSLSQALISGSPATIEVTLTHAIGMKLYCDLYILRNVKMLADKEQGDR